MVTASRITGLTLSAVLLLDIVLVIGLLSGRIQAWPPPVDRPWFKTCPFWFTYILFISTTAGFIGIGLTTRTRTGIVRGALVALALLVVLGGMVLTVWGIVRLNLSQSLGTAITWSPAAPTAGPVIPSI